MPADHHAQCGSKHYGLSTYQCRPVSPQFKALHKWTLLSVCMYLTR